MSFITDQADELIAIIQSGDAQALITALKEVNTWDQKTRKLDRASQIAMERVQDCLRERLERQKISLSATDQASINLLFDIHLADDVNTDIDPERRTLLERALAIGDVEILNLLKQPYGVNVDAQDENGDTLLHRLLKQRNYTAARLLIDICHAAINIPPFPLHIVVRQRNIDMAKFLIDHGACASEAEKTDFLDCAASSGVSMVRLFMQQVRPLSDTDKAACFSTAAQCNRLDVVKFLVRTMGVDVNEGDGNPEDLLKLLVDEGAGEVFEYLMNLDQLDRGGIDDKEFMEAALDSGSSNIMRSLVENSSRTDTDGVYLHQGLADASRSGDWEAITFWMKQGADPHSKDDVPNQTVLNAAAEGGHRGIVKFWLKRGVDLSAIDYYTSETVLHNAVRSGNVELVEYLFTKVQKKKMDLNTLNNRGQTPLDLAASRGDLAMVKCLLPKSPRFNAQGEPNFSHLVAAAKFGHLELVLYLLEQTDLEIRDHAKGVALRAAIAGVEIPESRKNALELARLLLKRGATLPQDAEVPAALRGVVKDYSPNPAAAKRIRQAVSGLIPIPELLPSSKDFHSVLPPIIFDYVGAEFLSGFSALNLLPTTQESKAEQKAEQPIFVDEPKTIVLVEEALRTAAKAIDNPTVAGTREARLEKLEGIRREVIVNLDDVPSRAECNLYWRRLKRAFKETVLTESFQKASYWERNTLLDKAFAAIPTPSTTYVSPPSLAPVLVQALPVVTDKRERKENKGAPAFDKEQEQSTVQLVSSSSSSSSSISSSQPQPVNKVDARGNDKRDAGFSWMQLEAAREASLKEPQRRENKKSTSRVPTRRPKRERDESEREREQPVSETTVKAEQGTKSEKKNKNETTARKKCSQDLAGSVQWESDAVGISTKEEEPGQRSVKGYALGVGHFGETGQSKSKAEKRGREPSNGLEGPTKVESDPSSRSEETAESEPVPKMPKDQHSVGPSKR